MVTIINMTAIGSVQYVDLEFYLFNLTFIASYVNVIGQ